MVLENGEIQIGFYARLLSRFDELLVMLFELVSKEQAFLILFKLRKGCIVNQLLSACLHSEVGLPGAITGLAGSPFCTTR